MASSRRPGWSLLQLARARHAPLRPSSRLSRPSSSAAASSVSPTEVAHFDRLAATWWDPRGPSRLLHLMNPLRHDFIATCLAVPPADPPADGRPGLRYLDVGCGGGIFAESAARLAGTARVTALDPTPAVLRVAERHAAKDPALLASGKLEYRNTSIEALPAPATPADQYDVLALWEVVEHVRAPAPFLDACARFVRPGGWLVGSTVARAWTSWLTTKVVAEDVLRLVPRGTHDWHRYINPEELVAFVGRWPGWAGWRAVGCVYVPGLGWRMALGAEAWGNYFFAVRREPLGDEPVK